MTLTLGFILKFLALMGNSVLESEPGRQVNCWLSTEMGEGEIFITICIESSPKIPINQKIVVVLLVCNPKREKTNSVRYLGLIDEK